jgi:hypothetical protein
MKNRFFLEPKFVTVIGLSPNNSVWRPPDN